MAALITRRPWLWIGMAVILAAIAGWYAARRLEFRTSRNDLIGRDSEYWRLFSEYAREFRDEEDYIVVVESADPARNRQVVDALAVALLAPRNNPHPADDPAAQQFSREDVFYRVDFDALQPWFLYYLSVAELTEIRDAVKEFQQLVSFLAAEPTLVRFFEAMGQMLDQMAVAQPAERQRMEQFLPTVTAIVRQMAEFRGTDSEVEWLSPWASAFFSEAMLREAEQQMKWKGYNVFAEGRMFLLLVHPRAADNGPAPHAATVKKLRRILAEVSRDHPDVRIGLTGEPVLDLDEMLQSQRDATRATMLTLVLIAVLFACSFREVLRPLLATGCLVLTMALSLGWATFSVGHLNLITVTFTVMILGLGIDLGIQIIARFEEELARGAARLAAIEAAVVHAGPGIITSALTNAAAFLAMGLSGFRGVIELGIIAAGGMVLALCIMLVVLPALLVVVWRRSESVQIPAREVAAWSSRYLLRAPGVVLVLCGVVTIAAAWFTRRVGFDYNVLNLQSRGLESVEVEKRLLQADAQSTIFAAIVCNDLSETRRLHRLLEQRTGVVASVASIAPLLPEQQEEKAPLIRAIQQELGQPRLAAVAAPPDVAAVRSALRALQVRARHLLTNTTDPFGVRVLGDLTNAVAAARMVLAGDDNDVQQQLHRYQQRFYADLQTQLDMMASQITDRPMTPEDLPRELRALLMNKSGTKFLLRVFPRENIWEREPLTRFVQEVQAIAPQVTGTPLGVYEFVEIIRQGYVRAALWASLVIAVLVFLDFRRLLPALLTLVPLGVGTIWMTGAVGLLGIPFNPANVMTLPLIVGIGVAYGIYVMQRFREDHDARVFAKSTGRAVVLSGLTTVIGFGSLIIGKHRGIVSLGVVMSIGVLACLVASLTLLPALLEIARRRRWPL